MFASVINNSNSLLKVTDINLATMSRVLSCLGSRDNSDSNSWGKDDRIGQR